MSITWLKSDGQSAPITSVADLVSIFNGFNTHDDVTASFVDSIVPYLNWPEATLFTDNNLQVLGIPAEICGKRMILKLPTNKTLVDISESLFVQILGRAQVTQCRLLQGEIAAKIYKKLPLPRGFFASSLMLSGTLDMITNDARSEPHKNGSLKFHPINFQSADVIARIAELELAQRWEFPWLTVREADTFANIQKDYSRLASMEEGAGIISAASVTNWREAFGFAYVNHQRNAILGGYIWVDPNLRGQKYGPTIVQAMFSDPKLRGYRITGLCSAANFNSLRTMAHFGMVIEAIVVHRLVPEHFQHQRCEVTGY
jgi:RimJ/RimL family protein N-acetyltransferase